jgi:hypothetical protein
MYARFTPRGLFAGRIAAKVFLVGAAVAILASIVRSSNHSSSTPSSGYYQAPSAEPAVTARSPTSPVAPILRPFASSSSDTSPVVPTSDRPAQSPFPMASPNLDRVVVPVVIQRDPPPMRYEQPQRWEYTQWDLRPIYRTDSPEPVRGLKPERPAVRRTEPTPRESEQPSDRRQADHPDDNKGQRRRDDPPQRAQGVSKESHGSTSSARPSSARTSSGRMGERRAEPAPNDGDHTTSGRPTHSTDSKPSPTQGKPELGDRSPRKVAPTQSR